METRKPVEAGRSRCTRILKRGRDDLRGLDRSDELARLMLEAAGEGTILAGPTGTTPPMVSGVDRRPTSGTGFKGNDGDRPAERARAVRERYAQPQTHNRAAAGGKNANTEDYLKIFLDLQ